MQVGIDHSLGKGKYPLVDFLVSRRVASYLLVLFILLSIMGTLIPQEMLTPPEAIEQWQGQYKLLADVAIFLGLTRMFTSIWFLTVAILFFLSISLCTYRRTRVFIKTERGRRQGITILAQDPETSPGSDKS